MKISTKFRFPEAVPIRSRSLSPPAKNSEVACTPARSASAEIITRSSFFPGLFFSFRGECQAVGSSSEGDMVIPSLHFSKASGCLFLPGLDPPLHAQGDPPFLMTKSVDFFRLQSFAAWGMPSPPLPRGSLSLSIVRREGSFGATRRFF